MSNEKRYVSIEPVDPETHRKWLLLGRLFPQKRAELFALMVADFWAGERVDAALRFAGVTREKLESMSPPERRRNRRP